MTDKVIPLRSIGITPQYIIGLVGETIHDIEDIYIVAIKKDGQPQVSICGDRKGLAYAAFILAKHQFDIGTGWDE